MDLMLAYQYFVSDDSVHLTKVGSNLLSRNLGLGVRISVSKLRLSHTNNKTHLPRNYVTHSEQRDAGGPGTRKREPTKPHMQQTRKPRRSLNEHPIRRPNNPNEDPLCDFCGLSGHLSVRCRFGYKVTCHKCQVKGHKANCCPNA